MAMNFEDKNYTWRELRDTGEDFSPWKPIDFAETVEGRVDFKVWSISTLRPALVVNMTLDDGRKIRFTVWALDDYNGMKDTPIGTRLKITSVKTRNRRYAVKSITLI